MKKYKRNNKVSFLLILICILSIGYAFLRTELKINGTANVMNARWDIHFANLVVNPGSVELSTGNSAATISASTTEVTYAVTLKEPGDFYEFSVDAVNAGTIDAMIERVSSKMGGVELTTLPAYMEYSVTYSDGVPLEQNHYLKAGETEKYKVRIGFKKDINASDLTGQVESTNFNFSVTYIQADENAINRPFSLYGTIEKQADLTKTIDFSQSSSDTNGKGVYRFPGSEKNYYPIYYYRGNIDNNNVLFAEKCWKIVRTTDQGGIKLIYNGIPTDGVCDNTGSKSMWAAKTFQHRDNYGSFTFGGYHYEDTYIRQLQILSVNGQNPNAYFGSTVTYENGQYKLVDPKIGLDVTHHYTCDSTDIDATCSTVSFYVTGSYQRPSFYQGNYYVEVGYGHNIAEAIAYLNDPQNDNAKSNAQKQLNIWYGQNLINYEDIIEDTNWCNEKKIGTDNNWKEDGDLSDRRTVLYTVKSKYEDEYPVLNCETTMNVANNDLEHPIALLTKDEAILAGGSSSNPGTVNNYYLRTGYNFFYLLTPRYFDFSQGVFMFCINSYGGVASCSVRNTSTYLRPAISLKNSATYFNGDGSKNNPYVVE